MRLSLAHCTAIALLTGLSGPANAQAQATSGAAPGCRLRIDTSATNWIIQNHDPFSGIAPTGTFDLLVSNQGEQRCQFYPQFRLDQEAFGLTGGGARRSAYHVYDLFSGTDVTPLSGRTIRPATARSVVVAPGGQQLLRYRFSVDDGDLDGDGLFSQRLTVEAQDVDGATLQSRQLVVGVNVLPAALVGLSGAFSMNNGQALVDLGELSEGIAPVPLQLRVRSTRAYSLKFNSLNAGQLKLNGTAWSIPYQLVVDDKTLPLNGEASYLVAKQGGSAARQSLPLRFAIGNVQSKRAGLYSDIVTVTVTPN